MSDDLVKRLRSFRCSLHETPDPLCAEAAAALVAKDAEIARLAEMLIESASWLEGTGNSGPMGYAKTIRADLENRAR